MTKGHVLHLLCAGALGSSWQKCYVDRNLLFTNVFQVWVLLINHSRAHIKDLSVIQTGVEDVEVVMKDLETARLE